ncbi:MAG: transglutaminase family protein [Verrucomicrobia bacterium]|nr:transglutaminase family protein [Verrucomicrobiota bacterium]MBI3868902.1 transglutaminase family protein [Verrucomicrobiota bacterium]
MRQVLYDITHTTAYDYAGGVSVSHHILRLTPRQTARQSPFTAEVLVDPPPAVVTSHSDYFGNITHFIAVERSHQRLAVTSRSRVGVRPAFIPEEEETPTWENVRAQCREDRSGQALEAHEFIYASPRVPVSDVLAEYAAPSFLRDRPILGAVVDLTRRIHADFKFDASATTVTTPVEDVFEQRRGVCQDFAQLEIACLRSLGLPARYVSGYLESDPPPGESKLFGADASHAWVAFYCPGIGWIDVDPTNNCIPSLRHITIGWGRDYGDVAPVRGVILGGSGQQLRIAVDVIAVDAGPEPQSGNGSQRE